MVPGEVQHRVVGARLIAVGVGDQRPGVVGHDHLRHAAQEAQRPADRPQPRAHRLVGRHAGEGVARRAHRRDEHLPAPAIGQRKRWPGVVDEQLLAGAVLLAHRALERLGVAPVVLAELREAPGALTLVRRPVLLPQQRQRHALAAQLDVHPGEVGLGHAALLGRGAKQPAFQIGQAQRLDRIPAAQARGTGQRRVLRHHALGDRQAPGDRLMRQPAVQLQSQYVLDHAYVHRGRCHRRSGKRPAAYGSAGQSHAAPSHPPDLGGHDAGPVGHDPEIAGHDAGTVGHDGPKYAVFPA